MPSRLLRTIGLLCLSVATTSVAQNTPGTKSLAERLGYPRNAKLLILTSDDLGMTHSIDSASFKALETGAITSGSVMVPCPEFGEVVAFARSHPAADLGIHLTLTAEWKKYRWDPLLPKDRVRSLFDSSGQLYRTETTAAAHVNPREAEAELRAQIDRALAAGLKPTHLDSHMGLLYENRTLFSVALRLSREYGLPLRMAKGEPDFVDAMAKPSDVVLDRRVTIDATIPASRWTAFYTHVIKSLKPGVTEMNVHLAYDDAEMRAVTAGHDAWGAAWRQRDVDIITSPAFRQLLHDNGVTLIGWHDVAKLMAKPH